MNRPIMLRRLADEQWDLLVIGGGISGAGVAREAALRGLRVGLVEQGDFGSGTSSRSGKMIIGGLRYLLNREFHLVRKGLRERDHLLDMAPHLVRRTPYLFPVWKGDPDSLWKIRLGLNLYDALGGCAAAWRHRSFDASGISELEPGLRRTGLRGGAQYWDCMTDDARLTIETIQSAAAAGAAIANYARVESFIVDNGRIAGASVRDMLSSETFPIRARTVLTAAGPWTDALRRLDEPEVPPFLRLVKGSFIVVPRERLPVSRNVTIRASDKRMTFAVPIRGQTYIGTTETDFDGDPATVSADATDVEYLLAAARCAFPDAGLSARDVISTWAGLRPLVGSRAGQSASKVTRDYVIHHSRRGLAILAGGKLTGFRAMGVHVVDELFPTTRAKSEERSLAPLFGAVSAQPGAATFAGLASRTGIPVEWIHDTLGRYGCQFDALAAEMSKDCTGKHAWLLAQTRQAVKREMAQRLTDVLWRRTGAMHFVAGNGMDAAGAVAAEMARLLDWTSEHTVAELAAYRQEVARMWAWRDSAEHPPGSTTERSPPALVAT